MVDEQTSSLHTNGLSDEVRMSQAPALVPRFNKEGTFLRYQSRKAENTVHRQKGDLSCFSRYLHAVGISSEDLFTIPAAWKSITCDLVEHFLEWQIEEGYAIESINAHLSTVKRYAGLACRAGTLPTDEWVLIREIKGVRRTEGRRLDAKRSTTRLGKKKAEPTLLSPDQLAQLFRIPNTETPQGWRDLFLLRLLFELGMRPGELVTATIADLDVPKGLLRIFRHKTGEQEQWFALSPEAIYAAKNYLDVRKDCSPKAPLFVGSRRGGRLVELIKPQGRQERDTKHTSLERG